MNGSRKVLANHRKIKILILYLRIKDVLATTIRGIVPSTGLNRIEMTEQS
jgi:hypothetical protein